MTTTLTTRRAAPTVPAWFNVLMKAWLRSPLHFLVSHNIMLLSFTGRRTGKPYSFPVRYLRDQDTLTSYTDSAWWKNFLDGRPVELLLKGQRVHAVAEPVIGTHETNVQNLRAYLRRMPQDAKYHVIKLDAQREPDPEDLDLAAKVSTMVRFELMRHQKGVSG